MKHIVRITKQKPTSADTTQDLFCALMQTIAFWLSLVAGNVPMVDYFDSKCGPPDFFA